MTISTTGRRVILDAVVDDSVIRGTLTAAKGELRQFHGRLELNTALEAVLDTRRDHRGRLGFSEGPRSATPRPKPLPDCH
jgi:hypothetical protein